jgi:23S rRNA (cytidine1920-2'-O)/16S rRNA (cytidine1409-2'-O)-methyltransferase
MSIISASVRRCYGQSRASWSSGRRKLHAMARMRADQLLVERGLVESRARAQAEIAAGHVRSGAHVVAKPSERLAEDAPLTLEGVAIRYVSRGGLKLAHALDRFALDVKGRIALDVGASAGGFTEVLLSRGVRRVYALDVGRGQLHSRLKADSRVSSLEGLDARKLTRAHVPEAPNIVTVDVSFISVLKVMPALLALAAPDALFIILVKPQFEVGREKIGKGGIVRDARAREEAVARVRAWLEEQDLKILGAAESPIAGGDGNVEYLLAADRHSTA